VVADERIVRHRLIHILRKEERLMLRQLMIAPIHGVVGRLVRLGPPLVALAMVVVSIVVAACGGGNGGGSGY
jgi:hypothetical protein